MNFVERFVLLAFLMASSIWGYAAGEPLGVVYPESESRDLEKVFDTIISGIEDATGARIDKYLLGKSFDSAKLEFDIKGNGNRVILALGARSRKAVHELDINIPVVVGAVLSEAEEPDQKELTGISMLADPSMLLNKLVSFAPAIKIVSVVYNPDNNQSSIDDASESARRMGLSLDARPARDIHLSAQIFKELADTVDGRINAIWLLPDRSTIDSDTILPPLLEKAWNRQFIVFSSKLDHAKRGVLFSMYPNNFQMGRDLGKLAKQVEVNPVRTGVTGLKSLKTAVNIRTVKHLGIDLLSRDSHSFDLVFPME
ncbi:MAG: ABC transporter substrate-binding protein [Methylococcales bacterium]